MRLVSYGNQQIGAVNDASVVELTSLVPHAGSWPPLEMVRFIADFDQLKERAERMIAAGHGTPLAELSLSSPVVWPNKLIAFPTNYEDHIREMSSANRADRNGFFLKAPSSLSGPSAPIVLPDLKGTREIHHEAELGIIIGDVVRGVPVQEAEKCIFGYTCLLDITVRGSGERVMRKSYDTFTPLGPALVTRDEIDDVHDLRIRLDVNGSPRQQGNTRDLILNVPEMVELAASVMTLYPGDVIASGTPAGVGPIEPGDKVSMRISGVGELEVDVIGGTDGWNVAMQAGVTRPDEASSEGTLSKATEDEAFPQ